MEFLSDENQAGQNLLLLVSRGSAIIAELLRLSDHIPSVFLGTDPSEINKYGDILFDFRYLKSQEIYDEKIDSDADMVELDEEFRETHYALLERFYKLFDSIYKYYQDFKTYLEDLTEGVYVQHTIESVLLDVEGKQLMIEALYLYGCMLLLMDLRIPGPTRERMIVSYYRYKTGQANVQNMDEVVKLCHTTGWVPGGKRPVNYPESLFSRFSFSKTIVEMMIGRLRSDDIYNRIQAFPAPDHRSTALSNQAAMIYVILYFAPHLLHKKTAVMREIVDKHFNDNWVIAFYMGYIVDLSVEWEPYRAAKLALENILAIDSVQETCERHVEAVKRCQADVDKYLVQGVLEQEYVLDNIRKLVAVVRNCNVTLRWFFLHRTTAHRKYSDLITNKLNVNADVLLRLLMKTAQFEFTLKELFTTLINEKESRWTACKKEASERMVELSEYFSGEKALTRVTKNQKLQDWFKTLADEISKLEYNNATLAGRKISRLIQALEEVEEFHQIETSLQVKSFLQDTRGYLTKMIRTVNVRQQVLGDLDIISDFSFAWLTINKYTGLIHKRIKSDPSIVLLLRATFLKLSSILSLPLVRITQCDSKDQVSVAEYYSSELVKYVRRVLDIIPKSVFTLLDEITAIQTHELKSLPTKMERIYIKDFAQLPERYQLARLTHQVSVFTEGVLAMKTTLVGIIKLDPKQLLEDGIRKQLVNQICVALNEHLVFPTGKVADFEKRVARLGVRLAGYRKSFEYIQDYIGLYGLKIWQEELSRIINYYVEQESNSFLKKKIYDWQSSYQSDAIPIPTFPRATKQNNQNASVNLMGRLVRELLSQTDPARTTYVEALQGWQEITKKSTREVAGIRTFDLLNRGVGVFGLTGMDMLLCFMIVRDLRRFVRMYRRSISNNGVKGIRRVLHELSTELTPTTKFPNDPKRLYQTAISRTDKLWPGWLDFVCAIGQSQLIRKQINNELNFTSKLDSKLLSCALGTLNSALLNDVKAHYARPDSKPYPGNPVLPELATYLRHAGINDPLTQIYITTEPLENLPLLAFMFVVSMTTKLKFSHTLNTLVCTERGKRAFDGAPFVVGIITLLKQFHSSNCERFLAYLGQFVRSMISAHKSKGAAATFPQHVVTVLHFLEEYVRFSNISRAVVEAHVPSYIFDRFR